MSQIHDLTALEQAEAVRRRELSPVEITDHYLDRIDRLDEQVGAFITVTAESAREQARKAEERVLRDAPEDLPRSSGCRCRSRTWTPSRASGTPSGRSLTRTTPRRSTPSSWSGCARPGR
ncbi:hypothetical protein ACFQXA_15250 [Nocardiopsis composta]